MGCCISNKITPSGAIESKENRSKRGLRQQNICCGCLPVLKNRQVSENIKDTGQECTLKANRTEHKLKQEQIQESEQELEKEETEDLNESVGILGCIRCKTSKSIRIEENNQVIFNINFTITDNMPTSNKHDQFKKSKFFTYI